jgi:hypothetical protein
VDLDIDLDSGRGFIILPIKEIRMKRGVREEAFGAA